MTSNIKLNVQSVCKLTRRINSSNVMTDVYQRVRLYLFNDESTRK